MGQASMERILLDKPGVTLVVLARPSKRNRDVLTPLQSKYGARLVVVWGDLTNYRDVEKCVRGADLVLHVGALVSPQADYHPQLAMQVNYGSTMNIITAIKELGQKDQTALVYIGTIAETGDRMPPIHWGRVGDPIKPSVYDYYAVSKVAAERAVIESGLTRWASLRQTGIIGPKMARIQDAIMFHNCLDNVLEYVSDQDSAWAMADATDDLPADFWCHVYNIGGGETCRVSTWEMYQELYGSMGIRHIQKIMDSRWIATRNFHGTYYLDSDKLERYLYFRHDSMRYFYDEALKVAGVGLAPMRALCSTELGENLIASSMRANFQKLARTSHGTLHFTEDGLEDRVAAYWGSRDAWEKIPPLEEFEHFTDWDTVVQIDHGYDESKPEADLTLADVQAAASFRGGECLSTSMATGDWSTKLRFRCAFGHEFEASPRCVLEGGHWCPVCERQSWNYYARAERDPFFAQVWTPLHPADEPHREWGKVVSEKDVVWGTDSVQV
jgi:nucleoside-diphosphate-sugar epimerase